MKYVLVCIEWATGGLPSFFEQNASVGLQDGFKPLMEGGGGECIEEYEGQTEPLLCAGDSDAGDGFDGVDLLGTSVGYRNTDFVLSEDSLESAESKTKE